MLIEHDYVKYALHHYSVPLFNETEFMHDLNKIVVLKKLFRRYTTSNTINERLVLNTFITLLNVFGIDAVNTLLFHKVETEHWPIVKTFLTFLNSYVDEDLTRTVGLDDNIVKLLGELRWHSRFCWV